MGALPYCMNTGCANCRIDEGFENGRCNALDKCLYKAGSGYCPFFKRKDHAKPERDAANARAERLGLLAPDGTYKQQRFVSARRVTDEDGTERVDIIPNIPAWLADLADRGSIPYELVTKYNASVSVVNVE